MVVCLSIFRCFTASPLPKWLNSSNAAAPHSIRRTDSYRSSSTSRIPVFVGSGELPVPSTGRRRPRRSCERSMFLWNLTPHYAFFNCCWCVCIVVTDYSISDTPADSDASKDEFSIADSIADVYSTNTCNDDTTNSDSSSVPAAAASTLYRSRVPSYRPSCTNQSRVPWAYSRSTPRASFNRNRTPEASKRKDTHTTRLAAGGGDSRHHSMERISTIPHTRSIRPGRANAHGDYQSAGDANYGGSMPVLVDPDLYTTPHASSSRLYAGMNRSQLLCPAPVTTRVYCEDVCDSCGGTGKTAATVTVSPQAVHSPARPHFIPRLSSPSVATTGGGGGGSGSSRRVFSNHR